MNGLTRTGIFLGAFLLAAALTLTGCRTPKELEPQTLKDVRPFVPRSKASASKPLNAKADFDRLLAALEGEDPKKAARAAMAMGGQQDPRALVPLVTALGHNDPSVRFAASRALEQFGSPAIPPLLDALEGEDATGRIGAIETLGGIGSAEAMEPLISVFQSDAPDRIRMSAAEALIRLDDPAVIPPLVEEMMDVGSDLRFASADALVEMGEAAVEPLLAELETGDSEEAWIVAETLGRIGDPRAVQPLIRYLDRKGGTEAVRMSIVRALGKIGDPSAVPALASRLKDPVYVVKKLAADSMVPMGEPAVDPLVTLLGEEDPVIQDLASGALVRIGQPSVEPLLATLADADTDVDRQWVAIATLGQIGDDRAVAPLARYLHHPNPDLALVATEALGSIGERVPTAASPPAPTDRADAASPAADEPRDEKAAGEAETTTAESMAEAIQDAAQQTTGPSPAEALAGALEDRTETLGLAASEALVKMGPSATGVLVAALKSENPEVRRLSSEALAAIGSPSVDPLLEAFRSEDERLRETAAETLTALGETSVTALAKALPEADAEGQRRMSDLLTAIGSPSAVQVLVDALRDWRTRQAAARALDEAGWEPDTPEDRVHLWVAQGRRKALMDQWRITRYVLSKDLTSGSRRDTEYAVRAWIALGNEESVPEMLEYLEEAENQQIALMFYQSGNPRLAKPAEKWFREQQLDPEAMLPILAGDTPAVPWGSMGQPQ